MGARGFVVPSSGKMSRLVARYLRSCVLLEDLWVSGRAPERAVCKHIRVPRGIGATFEFVDAVEPGDGQVPEREARPMEPAEATHYRAMAARLSVQSIDLPDLQFCCKEAARQLAVPSKGDWAVLKRVGRYLLGRHGVAHL